MIWVLQRLHHREQYGSVMCWNIMHQFKPIMHFEMKVSSYTWSCAARVLQLQYPNCCSCLSTYWNVAAWLWILKGCLYTVYFNNNFRRQYKIDVYLYIAVGCGRQWKHFCNVEMCCGLCHSAVVLTPEVGSKSLPGWVSSSLTETHKYSGPLVWFQILILDYRFV